MTEQAPYIRLSALEFNLCGHESIPVSEIADTAADIYRQGKEAYQTAFRNPGDMGSFNRGAELFRLAQKLENLAPEVSTESVDDLFNGLDALLSDTPPQAD